MRSVMEVLVEKAVKEAAEEAAEKAGKQAEDTLCAILRDVINGLDDDEIRAKYGARQDLIDRIRALLKKS